MSCAGEYDTKTDALAALEVQIRLRKQLEERCEALQLEAAHCRETMNEQIKVAADLRRRLGDLMAAAMEAKRHA